MICGIRMYKDHSIALIIPVYNEEKNIASVINSVPEYVDEVIVVDDKSTDSTKEILLRLKRDMNNLTLIEKNFNDGPGSAKREGYIYSSKSEHDIFVTIDGDGQMDPDEIYKLIDPIINGDADFTKANRLLHNYLNRG